jgi:hypothetical protein
MAMTYKVKFPGKVTGHAINTKIQRTRVIRLR